MVLKAHEPPFCSYFGVKKIIEIVFRNWWWPDLPKEVERIVFACVICQQVGPKRKKDKAPIETIDGRRTMGDRHNRLSQWFCSQCSRRIGRMCSSMQPFFTNDICEGV